MSSGAPAGETEQSLLEKLFSNIDTLVAYLDRDFNFMRVNDAFAALDGCMPDSLVGRNYFERYPDADIERRFRDTLNSGKTYRTYSQPCCHTPTLQNSERYWDWTLRPIVATDGHVEALILLLNEVTERVEAERQRRDSEQRFRMLFDNTADAILIHDLQGRVLEVNAVACQRLGYDRERFIGMTLHEIDAPDARDHIPGKLDELKRTGQTTLQTKHLCSDGSTYPVEVHARVIHYDGQPAILSIARDITERLHSERALHESKENLHALLNAISESVVMVDRGYKVVAVNATGALRMHSTPEELLGTNILTRLPPAVAARRQSHMDVVATTKRAARYEDERDGIVFDSSYYPVLDNNGDCQRIAIYSTDITERRRLERIERLFNELDRSAIRGLRLEKLTRTICNSLLELFDMRLAWVGRKQADGGVEIIGHGGDDTAYLDSLRRVGVRWDNSNTGHGPAGMALRSGEVQYGNIDEESFGPCHEAARHSGLRSVIALPLVLKGEVYAALMLYSDRPDAFASRQSVQRLQVITNRLRVVLETATDQEQLHLLGTALAAAGNGVLITDRNGKIQWVNEAFSQLSGYSHSEVIGKTPRILKSGKHDAEYYSALWSTILAGERWSCEAIERRSDRSLYTVRQTITPITGDGGEITHFIAIHEDVTAQKVTEERIKHMAHYDALTELPNRVLFYDRLGQAIARAQRNRNHIALMFLDLDRFKHTNDTLGHLVGDELLRMFARRVSASVRGSDTVARIGGDEFTVIVPDLLEAHDARQVAEKILTAMQAPFVINDIAINISTSIGIAVYPDDGDTDDALLRAADVAMYRAKIEGRDAYRYYTAEYDEQHPQHTQ